MLVTPSLRRPATTIASPSAAEVMRALRSPSSSPSPSAKKWSKRSRSAAMRMRPSLTRVAPSSISESASTPIELRAVQVCTCEFDRLTMRPALSETDSAAPSPLTSDELRMSMSRAASSARFTSRPGTTFKPAPLIVMSPAAAALPPRATTLTLVPLFNAASMLPGVTSGVNGGTATSAAAAVSSTGLLTLAMATLPACASHCPALPSAALASAASERASSTAPEVSICPPLPPGPAPRAARRPATMVTPSLRTATRPPLPLTRASAASVAPDCVSATSVPLAPTCTSPPPLLPLASMAAPSNTPTRRPSSCTVPPRPALPLALMSPRACSTPWLPASTTTRPPCSPLALMPRCSPLLALRWPATVMSSAARSTISPPGPLASASACIRPCWLTMAACASMRPLRAITSPKLATVPTRSLMLGAALSTRSTLVPAASSTWPPGASITPLPRLVTPPWPAISAMRPPSALRRPSLITAAGTSSPDSVLVSV